jgi:hypothetical protein
VSSNSAHPHPIAATCTFVLSDGRRFRCNGVAQLHSTPSPSALERARGCVALTPLAVTPKTRAVIAAIDAARMCMTRKGLRVSGGPVFPQQSPTSPDGELIVGNGHGGAFVAFYTDASRAARLEPEVRQNTRGSAAQVERRGAVTVVWIHRPASGLRDAVLSCAFA